MLFFGLHHEKGDSLASAIRYGGFIVASLALAAPAFAAGDTSSGSGGETPAVGTGGGAGAAGGGAAGGRGNSSSLEEPIRSHDLPARHGVGHEATKVSRQA